MHSERAANAREECKKLKNIAKTVTQVTHIPSALLYIGHLVKTQATQLINV